MAIDTDRDTDRDTDLVTYEPPMLLEVGGFTELTRAASPQWTPDNVIGALGVWHMH